MIFVFFSFFLILSFIMYFASKYTSTPVLGIASSVFVFLLGGVLMLNGVVLESGFTESLVFDSSNVSVGSVVVYDYSSLGETVLAGDVKVESTFGFLFSVLGVLMFMSVMFHLGRGVRNE